MRTLALVASLALVTLTSGCQTQNSNSQDASNYSSIGGSPGFADARAVFSASCSGCHDYHAQTEAQLKAGNGLLVGGDPDQSKLYYRLAGAPGGNMPQGGSLSAADVQAIFDWISNVP